MTNARIAIFLLAVSLLPAVPSRAERHRGGARERLECLVDFEVTGTRATKNRRTCTDGDPACDMDGACNGVCRFDVVLCRNRNRGRACASPELSGAPVVNGEAIGASNVTGAACDALERRGVPLKLRFAHRKASARLVVDATATNGRHDVDTVVLLCRARKGACPTTTTSTTTSTSSSTSTTLPCGHAACAAEEIVLTSGPGTLKVGGYLPFPFPAGVRTVLDVKAGDSGCRHDVIVPTGGFVVPPFCIESFGYASVVIPLGCASGGADGKGTLWDAYAPCPSPDISRKADSSDGTCGSLGSGCDVQFGHCAKDTTMRCSADSGCIVGKVDDGPCQLGFAGAGADTLGDIDAVRGGACAKPGKVHNLLNLRVRSLTWTDSLGCPGDGVYNPDDGDSMVSDFEFILSPTTGTASAEFADKNGDGCSLPKSAAGAGVRGTGSSQIDVTPGPTGPVSLTGAPADGPCCQVGQESTTVAVGAAFSGGPPLFDLIFRNITPSSVTACNPPGPADATCMLVDDPNGCLD